MDEKEQEIIDGLKDKNRLLEQQIADTDYIAKKTRKRLRNHLIWTYSSFWTVLLILAGIVHFVAGAYTFFKSYVIQSGESAGMIWYECTYLNNAFAFYIFVVWICVFVFIGYVWLWGLIKIDESTRYDK